MCQNQRMMFQFECKNSSNIEKTKSIIQCKKKGIFMQQSRKILIIFIFTILMYFHISTPKAIAGPKPMVIKLAMLPPSGSPWHEILLDMAEQWKTISNGKIIIRLYPGGIAGTETDMIRKMRIGQLHAAALSSNGLKDIAEEVSSLVIPFNCTSWNEFNDLKKELAPKLEAKLANDGFIVLNWGIAGWVRFFVPNPESSIDAVRKSKMFVWAGDDPTIEIWKSVGFNVVPLSPTDMLPALQTGMINAYPTTALMSLASQWFAFTPYMIDMPWAPLVGAVIISKKTWDKIPDSLKPALKNISEKTGERLEKEIIKLEDEAVSEMQKRGLQVIVPDEQQLKEWESAIKSIYPVLRGSIIPEEWFDEAVSITNRERKND